MRTLKELNYWSKKVWGIPFWLLLVVCCAAEYAISLLPRGVT